MKNKISLLIFALLAIGSAACGSSSSSPNGAPDTGVENQELTYQYNLNGCDTGSHQFPSLAAYCAGLESSSLNKGCALSMREQFFQQKCVGMTWTPN